MIAELRLWLARQIVLRQATIVGAVVLAVHWAQARGWLPDVLSDELVIGGATFALLLLHGWLAQRKTTPADPALSPTSVNGLPLEERHPEASS